MYPKQVILYRMIIFILLNTTSSDSDLGDNDLQNYELDSETANDTVFHHVNTNFVSRSSRKVGIFKKYM